MVVVREFDVETSAGGRKHMIWSCRQSEASGLYAWSLRRVLTPLFEGSMPGTLFEVGRFLRHKHSCHFAASAAATLGQELEEIIWAPAFTKRLKATEGSGQEWRIRTSALISLLCSLVAMRRKTVEKELALATLASFLSATAMPAETPEDFIHGLIEQADGVCDDFLQGVDTRDCQHVYMFKLGLESELDKPASRHVPGD